MGRRARNVLIVSMDVAPEMEEEFNRWYDTEHIPLFMKVPGVLSARRAVLSREILSGFELRQSGPRYITVYEYAGAAVMDQRAYRDVVETEWSKRLQPYITNFSLTLYELLPSYQTEYD